MNSRLRNILNDRILGASTLYRQTLELLLSDTSYHAVSKARKVAQQLRKRFPEMAVFAYLENRLDTANDATIPNLLGELLNEVDKSIDAICREVGRYWKKPRRIVTLSRSSVVTAVITKKKQFVASVLISESSPKREGILTAKTLASQKIDVEVVTDAALPGMVRKDDLVLLGADSIGPDYIINKTGSFSLALAAKQVKASVFVVAEPFKRLPLHQAVVGPNLQPPSEIYKTTSRYIQVTNRYFEKVPLALIDRIITG
ncbi:MAG: hypothetical protein R3F48_09735 [Candidatus Zixiibacteriota bacterium]